MKKIISFEKKIEFPSMIGEITAISLEHDLKFIDGNNIEGMFTVSGAYKLTEASRIEENFSYELPAEIILGETLDITNSRIEIDDFYYEIENDYNLICYIDVKVEGVEIVELDEDNNIRIEELPKVEIQEETTIDEQELKEVVLNVEEIELPNCDITERECDGDPKEEKTKERENDEIMQTETNPTVSSLFENINESEETYATYSVYILREEETITSLISKYKTTKEELENYNDLSNLSIGSKIIIPQHEE